MLGISLPTKLLSFRSPDYEIRNCVGGPPQTVKMTLMLSWRHAVFAALSVHWNSWSNVALLLHGQQLEDELYQAWLMGSNNYAHVLVGAETLSGFISGSLVTILKRARVLARVQNSDSAGWAVPLSSWYGRTVLSLLRVTDAVLNSWDSYSGGKWQQWRTCTWTVKYSLNNSCMTLPTFISK